MTAWRRDGADLILSVKLTPNSAKGGVGGLWTDDKGAGWLRAQVCAVPEKGKANLALVALLADRLKTPKRTISLEAGDTNRLKRLRIAGADEALATRLKLLADMQ